ncbi:MAG TPA: M28 family peptidase [Verrucomicrobiae bacterium]|nr:M28 family peptidase [Verrucomicrobiae bacterium]
MARNLVSGIILLALLAGCGGSPAPPPPIPWQQCSGDRACAHVAKLVGFGPRPSGSEALGRAASYITAQLQDYGLTTDEQVFIGQTPFGTKQFRNVIAKTRVQQDGANRVIIIGSHYDTKLFTNVTFVGANDGGSSSGTLLEIARVAADQPNLWFVFFDGEEAMVQFSDTDGLWGSKFFVENLKKKDQVGNVKAMILLDMVGDKNLKVTVAGTMGRQVFDAARAAGYRDYFTYGANTILDDHVPFERAGIPAVDLIDADLIGFNFANPPGPREYWHTERDTLNKIAPHSLEVVGQTTLRLIELLQNQPAGH